MREHHALFRNLREMRNRLGRKIAYRCFLVIDIPEPEDQHVVHTVQSVGFVSIILGGHVIVEFGDRLDADVQLIIVRTQVALVHVVRIEQTA
ncbi:hypothetical protein D3C71_1856690 [compost metagenome]